MLMLLTVTQLLSPNIKGATVRKPTNPLRAALVPEVLNQPMFFEVTMYMVSTHLDVLRRTEDSRRTLFHRGKSLQFINECLQQQKTRPSDLLITTALGLVNYDVSAYIPMRLNEKLACLL